MDPHRFDLLVATLGAGPRRGLLRWLLTLLLSDPLALLPGELVEARGRRKRRKKRHKHAGRRRKAQRRRRKPRRCKSRSLARVCADRCGVVRNNCRKRVDCGSCDCAPRCPICQVCEELTATCVPDPALEGQPCGSGQVCQEGACVCDGSICNAVCGCPDGFLCEQSACEPCDVTFDGDSTASGAVLQNRLTTGGNLRVCPGRYENNFEIRANVVLIGAGDGEDEASSTILDAGGSGRTVTVFEPARASLQGVRITGGSASNGGGIRNMGNLTLTACTVSGNSSSLGGGIYNSFTGPSSLTLDDCRVIDNTATVNGGGLHNNSVSVVRLNGCTFALNDSGEDGGGILNNSGTIEITNTEISENEAQGDGGGVFNSTSVATSPGDVTFDADSSITSNTAGAGGGAGTGGGIFNEGTVTLGGADVSDNDPDNCAGMPIVGCVEET